MGSYRGKGLQGLRAYLSLNPWSHSEILGILKSSHHELTRHVLISPWLKAHSLGEPIECLAPARAPLRDVLADGRSCGGWNSVILGSMDSSR